MIKTAKIIKDTSSKDEVGLGKKVTIEFLDTKEIEEFIIVTTVDVDPLNNKISIESPLGKAIYKHKVGQKIPVSSPNGYYYVVIKDIH